MRWRPSKRRRRMPGTSGCRAVADGHGKRRCAQPCAADGQTWAGADPALPGEYASGHPQDLCHRYRVDVRDHPGRGPHGVRLLQLYPPPSRPWPGPRRALPGDLSARVKATSRDEIGVLAMTFNHMAASLESTYRDLEQLNIGLEEKGAGTDGRITTAAGTAPGGQCPVGDC